MATTIALRNRLKASGLDDAFSEEELQTALDEAEGPRKVAKALNRLERRGRELEAKVEKVAPYLMPMDAGMVEKACSIMAALHDLLARDPVTNVAAPQVHVPLDDVSKGLQGLVEALGKAQAPSVHNAPVVNVPLDEVAKGLGGIVRAIADQRRPQVTVEAAQHKVYVPMTAVAKAISDLAVAFKQMPAPEVNPVVHVKIPRVKRTTTTYKRDGAGELVSSITEYVYEAE